MRPAAGIPWPPPLQTTFARQGSSQTGLVTRESTLPWQGVFAITGKLTLHLGVEAEVRRVVTCRLAVRTPQAALFLVLRPTGRHCKSLLCSLPVLHWARQQLPVGQTIATKLCGTAWAVELDRIEVQRAYPTPRAPYHQPSKQVNQRTYTPNGQTSGSNPFRWA